MSAAMHSQGRGPRVRTCSECRKGMEAHWHCPGCGDYRLCSRCYGAKGHAHKMVKVGPGLAEEAQGGEEGEEGGHQAARESRSQSLQSCLQSLVHACRCRGARCAQTACQKMKRLVQHSRGCPRKTGGGCPVCKQLIALCCCHAKQCQENPCPVPFCLHIKQKLRRSGPGSASGGAGSSSSSASS